VKLAILGSGTAIPHPRRGASGYALIAAQGEVLLLECGPGSTRRWAHVGITFERVRAILITHHHVDHCSDLPAVLFGRNVCEPPVTTPLALIGPRGHAAWVEGLERLYGTAVADPAGARDVVEMGDGDRYAVGPFAFEVREVLHVPGALGARIEADGRTFVFSGDSGICPALVELCRGADLALLECSYPASRSTTKHLSTRTAAHVAHAAGVRRLILTHFYPICDTVDIEAEVRAAGYEGDLVLAEDGALYEV